MLITPFFGEILILSVLAICCLRTYFITNTRRDSLALFAPFAVLLNVLQIINWGFNISEILILIITIIVAGTNWRSFIRFCNHLYVDEYSTPFIVSSSISLVLIIFMGVVLHINYPRLISPSKYQVTVETTYYNKGSDVNYSLNTELFGDKSLKLTVYSPEETKAAETDKIVLFVPDKRASTIAYQPYLVLLAKQGYKIYCGEFGFSTLTNSSGFRFDPGLRFKLIHQTKKAENEAEFFEHNPKYYLAYAKEFEILSKIADKLEDSSKKFVLVGDASSGRCFNRITNPARPISAAFNLSSVSDYKTSGFGFIEYTDPLYAKLRFGVRGNRTYFVPSYAATLTKNVIEAVK